MRNKLYAYTRTVFLIPTKQFTKHITWIVRAIFLYWNQCHDWKVMSECSRCETQMQKKNCIVLPSNPAWASIIYTRANHNIHCITSCNALLQYGAELQEVAYIHFAF